jgi:hypothetical protein
MELNLLDAAFGFCGGTLGCEFFGTGADACICGIDVIEEYFLCLMSFGGNSIV